MSSNWRDASLALGWLATAAMTMVGLPGEAEARDPDQSQLVSAVEIDLAPAYEIDRERSTIYVGLEECSTVVANNAEVSITFETLHVMTNPDLFGGVYHYNYPRGQESRIACRTADGTLHEDCAGELSGDEVTPLGNDVDVAVEIETLTGLTEADDCVEGAIDQSYYVQLRLRRPATTGVGSFGEWSYEEVRLVIDLVRPEAPTLTDALTTENSIYVDFESSPTEDVSAHHVVFSTSPFSAGDDVGELERRRLSEGVSEEGRVSASLTAGTTVYVGMAARDRAGNFSVLSAPVETTVIETNTFWDYYREAGGGDGGYGCQAVGRELPGLSPVVWAVAALLGVVGMGYLGRRRTQLMVVASKEKR